MANLSKGVTISADHSKTKVLKPVLKGRSNSNTATCLRVHRISADKAAHSAVTCNSRVLAHNSQAMALAKDPGTLAAGALRKGRPTGTSEVMGRNRGRLSLVANKVRWDLVSITNSAGKDRSKDLPASIAADTTNITVTNIGDHVRDSSVVAVNNADLNSNFADKAPKVHPMVRNNMGTSRKVRDRAIPASIMTRAGVLPWAPLQVATTFR